MSDNKQVFEVISIFTLGINMSSANYVNMIFNESSKNVITVDNIAMGYDVVKIGDDLYQVNLNLGSKLSLDSYAGNTPKLPFINICMNFSPISTTLHIWDILLLYAPVVL